MILASCIGAAGFAFILARFSNNIVGVGGKTGKAEGFDLTNIFFANLAT